MKRERWKRLLHGTAVAGLAFAWLGIVFKGKDGTTAGAILYYATPWLLRLLSGLLAVVVLRHRGFRLMAATCVLLSLVEGWHSFRWSPPPPVAEGTLQISVWNAGRKLSRLKGAWPQLPASDLQVLVEAGDFGKDERESFAQATPGMTWLRMDTSVMLGVRGRILSHESLGVHDRFRCHRARVLLPSHGELAVIVADVRSQPWISRERALATILDAAESDPRTIILGDFNTPPGSQWYGDWHGAGFTLANDGPRRGFRETWAYGLPLWTLDQIWLGKAWKVSGTRHSWHGSDHARVTARVGIAK